MAETLETVDVYDGAITAQLGTVYTYVVLLWPVPVRLSGVPAIVLNDGLGNDFLPEKASPQIVEEARWKEYTILRYQSIPRFAQFEVTIPSGITVIEDGDGNTPKAETVIVAPDPPPPPPPP